MEEHETKYGDDEVGAGIRTGFKNAAAISVISGNLSNAELIVTNEVDCDDYEDPTPPIRSQENKEYPAASSSLADDMQTRGRALPRKTLKGHHSCRTLAGENEDERQREDWQDNAEDYGRLMHELDLSETYHKERTAEGENLEGGNNHQNKVKQQHDDNISESSSSLNYEDNVEQIACEREKSICIRMLWWMFLQQAASWLLYLHTVCCKAMTRCFQKRCRRNDADDGNSDAELESGLGHIRETQSQEQLAESVANMSLDQASQHSSRVIPIHMTAEEAVVSSMGTQACTNAAAGVKNAVVSSMSTQASVNAAAGAATGAAAAAGSTGKVGGITGFLNLIAGGGLFTQGGIAIGVGFAAVVFSIGLAVTIAPYNERSPEVLESGVLTLGSGGFVPPKCGHVVSERKVGYVEFHIEALAPFTIQENQLLLEGLFRDVYNQLTGMCLDPFARVMHKATLTAWEFDSGTANASLVESITSNGHYSNDTIQEVQKAVAQSATTMFWEAEIRCEGCPDYEPLFGTGQELEGGRLLRQFSLEEFFVLFAASFSFSLKLFLMGETNPVLLSQLHPSSFLQVTAGRTVAVSEQGREEDTTVSQFGSTEITKVREDMEDNQDVSALPFIQKSLLEIELCLNSTLDGFDGGEVDLDYCQGVLEAANGAFDEVSECVAEPRDMECQDVLPPVLQETPSFGSTSISITRPNDPSLGSVSVSLPRPEDPASGTTIPPLGQPSNGSFGSTSVSLPAVAGSISGSSVPTVTPSISADLMPFGPVPSTAPPSTTSPPKWSEQPMSTAADKTTDTSTPTMSPTAESLLGGASPSFSQTEDISPTSMSVPAVMEGNLVGTPGQPSVVAPVAQGGDVSSASPLLSTLSSTPTLSNLPQTGLVPGLPQSSPLPTTTYIQAAYGASANPTVAPGSPSSTITLSPDNEGIVSHEGTASPTNSVPSSTPATMQPTPVTLVQAPEQQANPTDPPSTHVPTDQPMLLQQNALNPIAPSLSPTPIPTPNPTEEPSSRRVETPPPTPLNPTPPPTFAPTTNSQTLYPTIVPTTAISPSLSPTPIPTPNPTEEPSSRRVDTPPPTTLNPTPPPTFAPTTNTQTLDPTIVPTTAIQTTGTNQPTTSQLSMCSLQQLDTSSSYYLFFDQDISLSNDEALIAAFNTSFGALGKDNCHATLSWISVDGRSDRRKLQAQRTVLFGVDHTLAVGASLLNLPQDSPVFLQAFTESLSNGVTAIAIHTVTLSPTEPPSSGQFSSPSTSASSTPSAVPTERKGALPSAIPSPTASDISSAGPSRLPAGTSSSSVSPSIVPSSKPSGAPSLSTSEETSMVPSRNPSLSPSAMPSEFPSLSPSGFPSTLPSRVPSESHSSSTMPTATLGNPTKSPTVKPSLSPSMTSEIPSPIPSRIPSKSPSLSPSESSSQTPSSTPSHPTAAPSEAPTMPPTESPSRAQTTSPSKAPTSLPSRAPTKSPTEPPTGAPTWSPTNPPTQSPTKALTSFPTTAPTRTPTKVPSAAPTTSSPTKQPTDAPTKIPTKTPTKAPTTTPTIATSTCSAPSPTWCQTGTITVLECDGDAQNDLYCYKASTMEQSLLATDSGCVEQNWDVNGSPDCTASLASSPCFSSYSPAWCSHATGSLLVQDCDGDGDNDIYCQDITNDDEWVLATNSGCTTIYWKTSVSGSPDCTLHPTR